MRLAVPRWASLGLRSIEPRTVVLRSTAAKTVRTGKPLQTAKPVEQLSGDGGGEQSREQKALHGFRIAYNQRSCFELLTLKHDLFKKPYLKLLT